MDTRDWGLSHQETALGDGWTSPPFHKFLGGVLLRESKGSWAKVRVPQGVINGGSWLHGGKPGTSQKSLKIKNHQGRLEWGGDASLLGISPSIVTPPGGPGATPGRQPVTVQDECPLRGRRLDQNV